MFQSYIPQNFRVFIVLYLDINQETSRQICALLLCCLLLLLSFLQQLKSRSSDSSQKEARLGPFIAGRKEVRKLQ